MLISQVRRKKDGPLAPLWRFARWEKGAGKVHLAYVRPSAPTLPASLMRKLTAAERVEAVRFWANRVRQPMRNDVIRVEADRAVTVIDRLVGLLAEGAIGGGREAKLRMAMAAMTAALDKRLAGAEPEPVAAVNVADAPEVPDAAPAEEHAPAEANAIPAEVTQAEPKPSVPDADDEGADDRADAEAAERQARTDAARVALVGVVGAIVQTGLDPRTRGEIRQQLVDLERETCLFRRTIPADCVESAADELVLRYRRASQTQFPDDAIVLAWTDIVQHYQGL